jgi:hypothetical protein
MDLKLNIDKETLIKHRFWIALGALVPLVLVAVIFLTTSVQRAIASRLKQIDEVQKGLKGISTNNPNQNWPPQLKQREAIAVQKREEIWLKAWKVQEPLLIFPTGPRGLRDDLLRKWFGDDINENLRIDFANPNTGYSTEPEQVWRVVDAWDGRTGAVQYGDSASGYKEVLHQIHWAKDWETVPTSEEIWLAQENLAVYHGLLNIIREANDTAGVFHNKDLEESERLTRAMATLNAELKRLQGAKAKAKDDPAADPAEIDAKIKAVNKQIKAASDRLKQLKPQTDPGKGLLDQQTFTTNDWRLDLQLIRQRNPQMPYALLSRLTNISGRKLSLGLTFLVSFEGAPEPTKIEIDGESMVPNQWLQPPPVGVRTGTPSHIEGVRLGFDWRSVPIKRIEKLLFGPEVGGSLVPKDPTARIVPWPAFAPPKPAENQEEASGNTGSTRGSGNNAMDQAMKSGMERMGSGGGGGGGDSTPNGLVRNRYLNKPSAPNEAVRRIPVAMVLVMDESYLQDLLAAVANSRLRVQADLVEWQHWRGNVMPHGAERKAEREKKDEKKSGTNQTDKTVATSDTSEGLLPNLIRVAVYGRASLYGRYPPKEPNAASTTPSAPGP